MLHVAHGRIFSSAILQWLFTSASAVEQSSVPLSRRSSGKRLARGLAEMVLQTHSQIHHCQGLLLVPETSLAGIPWTKSR